jgi:hypothetical protein
MSYGDRQRYILYLHIRAAAFFTDRRRVQTGIFMPFPPEVDLGVATIDPKRPNSQASESCLLKGRKFDQ